VSVDQVVSDFDGVTFHLSTPESKSKILISIAVKCYSELLKYGAQEVLEREYGPYIVSPEIGYDFSVLIDLENLPDDPGRAITHMKSMLFADCLLPL
jgi:actin related protein 2/3 complex subunit 2